MLKLKLMLKDVAGDDDEERPRSRQQLDLPGLCKSAQSLCAECLVDVL